MDVFCTLYRSEQAMKRKAIRPALHAHKVVPVPVLFLFLAQAEVTSKTQPFNRRPYDLRWIVLTDGNEEEDDPSRQQGSLTKKPEDVSFVLSCDPVLCLLSCPVRLDLFYPALPCPSSFKAYLFDWSDD
jgi:hypothetical protein